MDTPEQGFDDVDGSIFTRSKFSIDDCKINPTDDILDDIIRKSNTPETLQQINEGPDETAAKSPDGTNLIGKRVTSKLSLHKTNSALDIPDSQQDWDSQHSEKPQETNVETVNTPRKLEEDSTDAQIDITEREELITPQRGGTLFSQQHEDEADVSLASRSTGCHTTLERQKDQNKSVDSSRATSQSGVRVCCGITLDLLCPAIGTLLFLADIGSDIYLALSYKQSGSLDLFGITISCIIIPSIVMAVVDISWVWLDETEKKGCKTVGRIVVGVFSLGRIWRAISNMYNTVKYRLEPDIHKSRKYKKRQLAEKRDCYILDFINAFTESCPQLIVQLYLFYKFNLDLSFLRVFSLVSSWMSIGWTYAFHYRSHREAKTHHLKPDVTIIGLLLYFLSILAALAARVCCLVLLMVCYHIWAGLVAIGVHFVVMFGWIVYQKPDLDGLLKNTKKCSFGRIMYYLFFSYVSCFCFVNLKNTKARCRLVVFYGLVYVENFIMAAFIIWRLLNSQEDVEKVWNLLYLGVGMAIHLLCLLAYYKFFHPSVGMFRDTELCSFNCKLCNSNSTEENEIGDTKVELTNQNSV